MTRKAKFLAFRAKCTVKMRKLMRQSHGSRGHRDIVTDEYVVQPCKPFNRERKGKQVGKMISPATNAAEGPGLTNTPPLVVREGGGWGSPPHVHVHYELMTAPLVRKKRAKPFAVYGGHQRRRVRIGRKEHKQTKLERQIFGANFFHWFNGYWPDWDVLHRHPNESQVLHGATPDPVGQWS